MSATSLSAAVRAAIEQNLSGVVAGELQSFIETARKQAAELERYRENSEADRRTILDLREQLSKHRDLDEKQAALEKDAKALQSTELALLKREAALDAKIAQAELGGVKYSMEAFLKNATVRETVVADVAKPVEGYPGGNGMVGGPGFLVRDQRSDVTTTTRTQE